MKPLHLSILLASHRTGLTAISRIAQVCSWAGPNIEVIVRDNSGDAQKRDIISRFNGEYCKIISVEPCEPLENFSSLLQLAKGDFIFWPADDDFSFDRAISGIPDILAQSGGDPTVLGVTGHYVVESSEGSSIAGYNDVDSDDPVARVAGYLSYGGPNVFTYSVIRRVMAERIFRFLASMPFYLSFHDQIQSLLFVASGKFIRMPRILYAYDVGVWERKETAEQRDLDYLTAAGLDPVVNTLQWLLCAFEGAVLARNSDIIPDYPLAQRQAMADRWFSAKFGGFVGGGRSTFGSRFAAEAETIRARLLAPTGQMSFERLLTEICNVLALFSQDKAQRYFEFWNAQINQSEAARRQAAGSAA